MARVSKNNLAVGCIAASQPYGAEISISVAGQLWTCSIDATVAAAML